MALNTLQIFISDAQIFEILAKGKVEALAQIDDCADDERIRIAAISGPFPCSYRVAFPEVDTRAEPIICFFTGRKIAAA
ncbi:hypothetical protein SE91_12755 [Bradyrhizobium sp. DOA1]|nr:hypothetical protein SE91_12755 [Bradyrhizobium sp. DOA1]